MSGSKKPKGGNPANRGGGRVTTPNPVPKHLRRVLHGYKQRGGTLEELQAVERALDQRIAQLQENP